MSTKLALALVLPALVLAVLFARGSRRTSSHLSSAETSASAAEIELAAARPPAEEPRQEPVVPTTGKSATPARDVRLDPPAPEAARVGPTELAGRVLDEQGRPVAGASVRLTHGELNGFSTIDLVERRTAQLLGETLSGPEGEFRFPLERGLPVDLCAELGLASAAAPGRYAGQFVELRLAPGYLVQGRVTAAGAPVAGARVRVFQRNGTPFLERSTLTQGDGSYELGLSFGERATLVVAHDQAGSSPWLELRFDEQGHAREDVELPPGITVVGLVTDAESGAPIAGATIGEGWTFARVVTSGPDGAYRFEHCDPGWLNLWTRAPGYGASRSDGAPAMTDGVWRYDFALEPGRVAIGRVVDESSDPLAGVYVAAVGQGFVGDTISARTDADGRFRLEPLAREVEHALFVTQRGRAVQVYDFPAAETSQQLTDLGQITLRGSQLVAGRVVDGEGEAVAGAELLLEGWNSDRFVLSGGDDSKPKGGSYVRERKAVSDADGRFWFAGVAPGSYWLSASRWGNVGMGSGPGMRVYVMEGEDREELELAFSPGLSIRGAVRDDSGRPLAGAEVTAYPESAEEGSYVSVAIAGTDGGFEFRGLVPGRYFIGASMDFVRNDTPAEPWRACWTEPVEAGGEPVALVLRRGATIEGVVRDAQGKPVPRAFVHALPEDPAVPIRNTDVLGRFRLEVPTDSVWSIEAYAAGQLRASASGVAAGTHDLVLEVR